jgi:hypothetical protein
MDENQHPDPSPDNNNGWNGGSWNQNNPQSDPQNNQGRPDNPQNNPWNQNTSYNQPTPPYQPYQPPHQSSSNALMTASLVMGILSIVLICCGFSFFVGALGVLFALLSRRDGKMGAQAKIGLGLSIAGSIIGIAIIIFSIATYKFSDVWQEYEKFYYQYDNENPDAGLPDIEDYLERYGNGSDSGDSFTIPMPDSGDSL